MIFRRSRRTPARLLVISVESGFRVRQGNARNRSGRCAPPEGFGFFRRFQIGFLRHGKRRGARLGERTVRKIRKRLFFGGWRRFRERQARIGKFFHHSARASARSEFGNLRNPYGRSGFRRRKFGESEKLGGESFARSRSDIENEREAYARELCLRRKRMSRGRMVDRVFRYGIRKSERNLTSRKRRRMLARFN